MSNTLIANSFMHPIQCGIGSQTTRQSEFLHTAQSLPSARGLHSSILFDTIEAPIILSLQYLITMLQVMVLEVSNLAKGMLPITSSYIQCAILLLIGCLIESQLFFL